MRWTAKRKAEIVAAIKAGTLSIEGVRSEFYLSQEELETWMRDLDAFGVRGLRALKSQLYSRRRRARSTMGCDQAVSDHNETKGR